MKDILARLNQGVEAHRAGRLDEAGAIYDAILAARPDEPNALHLLGVIHYQRGAHRRAIELMTRAREKMPDSAALLGNLGEAHRAAGELRAAEPLLRAAIAADPELGDACNNLGLLLRARGKLAEAVACHRRAVEIQPANAGYRLNLSNALRALDDVAGAEREARAGLEQAPDNAGLVNAVANIRKDLGDIDEAARLYRRAIALDPGFGQPYWNLATSRKWTAADEDEIAGFEAMLAKPDLDAEARIEIAFALGKIYDDLGDHDRAFAHLADANRRRRPPFDARDYIAYVDRNIAAYDRAFFDARRDFGDGSEVPVFVVGVIRSGTTLVEQIVASHPQAAGAGELRDIALLTEEVPKLIGGGAAYPEAVARLDRDGAAQLARAYLTSLTRGREAAARIVDKMPSNFLHLGFIRLLLPRARIVHCRRHPLDTCFSAFAQNFAEPPPFASDLAGLGTYYRHYARLMDHWRRTLDIEMMEIDYEDLVGDVEGASRRLIDFLGLEWDDSCLSFHETRRAVRTASSWQVRQPVYRSSVARWRRYDRHLGPLKAALGWRDDESGGA